MKDGDDIALQILCPRHFRAISWSRAARPYTSVFEYLRKCVNMVHWVSIQCIKYIAYQAIVMENKRESTNLQQSCIIAKVLSVYLYHQLRQYTSSLESFNTDRRLGTVITPYPLITPIRDGNPQDTLETVEVYCRRLRRLNMEGIPAVGSRIHWL